MIQLARRLATLSRGTKRTVMVTVDAVAFPAAVAGAIWLVTPAAQIWPSWIWLVTAATGLIALKVAGFYRSIVRFMGVELIIAAAPAVTATSIVFACALVGSTNVQTTVKAGIAFWLLGIVHVAGSRFLVRLLLRSKGLRGDRVVVYGAGDAGAQLAASVSGRDDFTIIAFVDDNIALHGAVINGLEVHSPAALPSLVEEFGVSRVLLALPSASRRRRQEIISRLETLPVHVQTMPDVNDLIAGKARVDEIRDVDIADLLGRDTVPPVPELLGACVTGKSVMVTGAGGSIGSELCVQIAQLKPRRLVLLEISEPALYTIDKTLRNLVQRNALPIEVVPLIGSVHHERRMREAMTAYEVETLYHAAAYKHVPLVEHNMIEGIHNNVFGTLHTAEAAIAAGVKHFVLVSTDKAVLPTNVMGATKRCAELVLQALNERGAKTTFSMVRFGNVLASSGSVVPLFREQIRSGGPVTVTHPEIYRYFMTIPEAAALVIQAGSMAKGGDVFVLDMGEPVRIRDLAETMIHLMGLSVKDKDRPDGDIEIKYTGLRPAEKLYEELLIGNNVMGTDHPSIMRAEEDFIPWAELEPMLEKLWNACQQLDCALTRDLLLGIVAEYRPTTDIADLVWRGNIGASSRAKPDQSAASAAANVAQLSTRRAPPRGLRD